MSDAHKEAAQRRKAERIVAALDQIKNDVGGTDRALFNHVRGWTHAEWCAFAVGQARVRRPSEDTITMALDLLGARLPRRMTR